MPVVDGDSLLVLVVSPSPWAAPGWCVPAAPPDERMSIRFLGVRIALRTFGEGLLNIFHSLGVHILGLVDLDYVLVLS